MIIVFYIATPPWGVTQTREKPGTEVEVVLQYVIELGEYESLRNYFPPVFADDSGDEGSLTSDGSVIRVPIRGHNHATREDSYSSGGSVMRVAIGGTAGEEDGYSSGGSVVRVPIGGYADEEGGTSSRLHKGYYSAGADACAGDDAEGGGYSSDGSVIRVPIGSIEDDNYSSDGSVVRVPVTKESMHPSAAHVRGRKGGGEGTPEPQAGNAEGQVLLQQRALEPQGGKQVDAEQSPANAMKMNLQAAARYFANKGGPVELTSHKVGGSKGAEGGQINGSPPALELAEQPPQVRTSFYQSGACGRPFVREKISLDNLQHFVAQQ